MTVNVLVTGGAGYIGSHACKTLYQLGYNPITIDNMVTGWKDAVKFGPLEEVDLLCREDVDEIFRKYKPHAVMHFAAYSQVGESVLDPVKYWRNNILGSLNLFQSCVDFGCKNVIFSSTCAVYGDQHKVVLTEETAQNPSNAYGSSKRAIEEILMQISKASELNYVIFRYFNVAGADPEGEIGEFHQPETHLIPLILDVVNEDRGSITVFGTDYETTDGTCIRDYIHVSDLIDAHILGLHWLGSGNTSKIFNLGTGSGFSVREVIQCVEAITNRSVPVIEGMRRDGDCARLVSGSMSARQELGWEPKRSTLANMISDAWGWHKKRNYEK